MKKLGEKIADNLLLFRISSEIELWYPPDIFIQRHSHGASTSPYLEFMLDVITSNIHIFVATHGHLASYNKFGTLDVNNQRAEVIQCTQTWCRPCKESNWSFLYEV